MVQRQVLYLGELNDNQRAGWVRTIEVFSGEDSKAKQLALFPDDREESPMMDCETIRVQLDKLVPVKTGIELRSPREWGACWLGLYLWDLLELDKFWKQRLPSSRKGTSSAGLPVISTFHSGIPELVQDGISGFLVPERDANQLAEKIIYLIEHQEIWAEMGQAGHDHVEKNYNIARLNDQLVELYQMLL